MFALKEQFHAAEVNEGLFPSYQSSLGKVQKGGVGLGRPERSMNPAGQDVGSGHSCVSEGSAAALCTVWNVQLLLWVSQECILATGFSGLTLPFECKRASLRCWSTGQQEGCSWPGMLELARGRLSPKCTRPSYDMRQHLPKCAAKERPE